MVFVLSSSLPTWSLSGATQHPGSHLGGTQTPHPHVLLPGESISAGHWVHHRYCSCHVESSPCPQAHSSLCSLLSQLFFFHLLAGMDCFLLTAMAYDRFLAICQPLTYSTRMSQTVQRILVVVSWACAITNALIHTIA